MAESTNSKSYDVMDKILLDFADFKCSICLEVYIDATWTSCNHLFCRFCISKWLEFSLKCPQCHTAVSKCTSVKAIDEQVDSLFQALPLAIRKDRDEVKDRRRKLETEGSGSIEHTNELLKKLRIQRDKAPATMMNDEQWMEKLAPYFQEENDCSKLQLPRLVPAPEDAEGLGGGLESKMKGDVKTVVENGKVQNDKSKLSTSQYENLKLPPITRSSSRLNRQARGITTTTCVQNAEDKFPMNMEGDISKDKAAEENIRELERRNTFLEEQLFGAYDRIMDAIKENDENLAKNVDPNVFKDNKQLRQKTNPNTSGTGVNRQVGDPNFSKESMINPNDTRSDGEIQLGSTNEVDDLLAETEDLIEIEDFLTKYPFERIRDDDNLINYNADVGDFDDELGLSVGLDQDKLDELAAHRAQRAKKPLTKEQQDIENFYKKLELKFQKQDSTHGLPVAIKVPKSITQETSSSKMKRIPNLNKFRPGPAQIPSNQSLFPNPTPLLNRTESKSSVASKISTLSNSNTKISKVKVSPIKPNHSILKSNVNVLDKLQLRPNEAKKSTSKNTNGYFDEASIPIEKEKQITRNGSNTTIVTTSQTTSDILVKKMPTLPTSATSPSATMATHDSIKVDGGPKNPVPNLNYEDFLKLEIDFLDGEGDWKQFDKPPKVKNYAQHRSSTSINNANNCQQIKGKSTSSTKSNIIVSSTPSNKLKSSLGGNNSKLMKMKSNIIEEDKQPNFNRVVGIIKSGNSTPKNGHSAATSSVTSSVTKTTKLGTTRNRR